MEPTIKAETVLIKEEVTIPEMSDYTEEEVASNTNMNASDDNENQSNIYNTFPYKNIDIKKEVQTDNENKSNICNTFQDENVYIKRELVTIDENLESDLINYQQASYIKEEVMISDVSDLSENEVPNDDSNMLRNNNMSLKKLEHTAVFNKNELGEYTKCGGRYKSLQNHKRLCGLVSFWQCDFCDHKTRFKNNMKRHMTRNHKDLTAEQIQESLAKLMKSEHKLLPIKVSTTTDNETAISTSDKFCSSNFVKLYCPKCNLDFARDATRTRKCRLCGTKRLLQCLKCGMRQEKANTMNIHLRTKCGPKEYFHCAHCDYRVALKSSLLLHIERRHVAVAPEDYPRCRKCDKAFKNRFARCDHEKFCGREPYLQCAYCPYKGKKKAYFKVHVKNHMLHGHAMIIDTGDGSKSGDAGILRASKLRSEKKNLRVEELMKEYCWNCDRKSKNKGQRKCRKCGSKLSYECGKCGKHYPVKFELRKHIGKVHVKKELNERYLLSL